MKLRDQLHIRERDLFTPMERLALRLGDIDQWLRARAKRETHGVWTANAEIMTYRRGKVLMGLVTKAA